MLQVQTGLTEVFLVGTTIIAGLVAFILLYVIVYLQKVNRFNKTLQQKELDRQAEIYQALISGEEKERKRLAEELHDGIGAKLAGLKMNLEFLHHEEQPSVALIGKTLEGINETIDELREISHNLQPAVISIKGLKQALHDYIANLNRRNTSAYRLYWYAEANAVTGPALDNTLYRLATELLHNAHRHAQARNILIQLTIEKEQALLMIEDDGTGMDSSRMKPGIGLLNIRSRTEAMGGRMNIDSTPGKGTTIIIEIPLANHENTNSDRRRPPDGD